MSVSLMGRIVSPLTLLDRRTRVRQAQPCNSSHASKNREVEHMFLRRSHWSIAILFLAAMTLSTPAQKRTTKPTKQASPTAATQPAPTETKPPIWESWDTLKPEKEDFSVLMPKDTATQIEPFEYHKMQLNARLYLSSPTTGPGSSSATRQTTSRSLRTRSPTTGPSASSSSMPAAAATARCRPR